jgi:hypothetical protein
VGPPLLDRLHADLRSARLARDTRATAALRAAVTAVENAAAVHAPPAPGAGEPMFVADVPRQALDDEAVRAVVRAEAEELQESEALYRGIGQTAEADDLAAQREVLARYVG